MGNVLMIGNGVNRLCGQQAWSQVLAELADWAGCPQLMDMHLVKHKPFSLIYEEIALRSCLNGKSDELNLKKEVARRINLFQANPYHKQIIDAASRHIITTNYDYTLESASGFANERADLRSETKYNVFRRRRVGDKYIWHIHGESEVPNSITLGHEQYAGQLQNLRAYVTANRQSKKKIKSPFKIGNLDFDLNEQSPYSWVDVFFRDDIHIIGLSLDYTEIDLWWLLAYKERLRRMSQYMVGKTIYYDFEPRDIDDQAKAKAKLSILESFGVETHPYRVNEHRELYDQVLGQIAA